MVEKLYTVCVFLFIGLGIQWFIGIVLTFLNIMKGSFQFESYSIAQWIFQIIYVIIIITIGLQSKES